MTLLEEVAQQLYVKVRMSHAETEEAAHIAMEAVAKLLGSRWVITEAHSGYKSDDVREANRAWLGLEPKE